jgi:RsmE family RNA methyltransferase
MNILLYKKEHLINELIHISDPNTLTHIQNILKLKAGDTLRVGEINGLLGDAKIESITTDLMTLTAQLKINPPKALPCSIVLALPRPQQLKRILLHLSSLGVKDIHLLQTARVEKNYWQSPVLDKHAIESYLIEGLQQAQDTQMPSIEYHKSYQQFIDNFYPKLKKNKQCWFAHPGNFAFCPKQSAGKHVVFIGPEGGFISNEVEQLLELGCKGVSLGSRILKVETAIPIILGGMFQLP